MLDEVVDESIKHSVLAELDELDEVVIEVVLELEAIEQRIYDEVDEDDIIGQVVEPEVVE